MKTAPKIRILWIDDRERVSGYPERTLPEPYSRWFEVVHPRSSDDAAMSYESAAGFMDEFTSFWFDGNTSYFPAEIIAVDYNIRKLAGAESGRGSRRSMDLSGRDEVVGIETTEVPQAPSRNVDFDGLLIGAFCATLTSRHPSALVSITNYQGAMPSEVDTLRELITPFLSIATRQDASTEHSAKKVWHNLPALERSWRNIILAGLDPLRDRIKLLYKNGDIVVSPADLMRILNGIEDGALTLVSPFACRIFPLHGLFCDIEGEAQRYSRMQEWANDLLECKVAREQYEKATKLAETIWSKYNDDVLLKEHSALSQLHVNSDFGEQYKKLFDKFKPAEKGIKDGVRLECTERCFDIRMGTTKEYSKEARRWAGLFLIRRLLKRILLFIRNTNISSLMHDGEIGIHELYPEFEEDDILLVLFPVPTSPFPLPWHVWDARDRDNLKGGWRVAMERQLGFKPAGILDGSALSTGERQVLQGLVIDEDIELGDDAEERLKAWKAYAPARLFLFGPKSHGGEVANE